MSWVTFLVPAIVLLVADALGWLDLTTSPLRRVVKWICAAVAAWCLPLFVQKIFHVHIDESHLEMWEMTILGVLAICIVTALIKWIWRSYGPVAEGYRRCKKCRQPVVKLMKECPFCRQSL